jgi:hypothetical protein
MKKASCNRNDLSMKKRERGEIDRRNDLTRVNNLTEHLTFYTSNQRVKETAIERDEMQLFEGANDYDRVDERSGEAKQ